MGYARNDQLEVSDLVDGVVLFDPVAQVVHHLNGPATLVWEVVEGRDFDAVREVVATVLEVPLEDAARITRTAIDQLVRADAVRE